MLNYIVIEGNNNVNNKKIIIVNNNKGDKMITNYKIKTLEGEEEVLILYFIPSEEISSEWLEEIKAKTINEYLKYKNIIWNGTKIILVISGIAIACLSYEKDAIIIDEINYINKLNKFNSFEIVDKINNEVKNNINKDILINDNNIDNQENNNSNNDNLDLTIKENDNKYSNEQIPEKDFIEETIIQEEIKHDKEEVDNKEIDNKIHINVNRKNGEIITLELQEYLIGVVAAEMPASFNLEALKVQSVIARTYVLDKIKKGITITDTVSTQKYIDKEEMKKQWGISFDKYYNKIKTAVEMTEEEVVKYNNELIECLYFSTSNGKTENSVEVWGNYYPYLTSVDSNLDKETTSYFREISISVDEFKNKLSIENIESIEILERNQSNRVRKIKVNNTIYSGIEFRNILNLRSTDFDITIENDLIKIKTYGYGHGVGLSQYGANQMANNGYNYQEIIKHYYQGVYLDKY